MATKITVEGIQYQSVSAAARHYNLQSSTVSARLDRGYSIDEAFELVPAAEMPTRSNRSGRPITVKGKKYKMIKDAAETHGFTGRFIANRINLGLTPEQALEVEPFPEWFVPGKNQKRLKETQAKRLQEINTNSKRCSGCKEYKTIDSFHGSYENGNLSSKCRQCISASFLHYRYGMSVSQFNQLREEQQNSCGICRTQLEIDKDSTIRSKRVAVDHCHASGKIRGLLCASCNTGLGLFKDSTSILTEAIAYLSQH